MNWLPKWPTLVTPIEIFWADLRGDGISSWSSCGSVSNTKGIHHLGPARPEKGHSRLQKNEWTVDSKTSGVTSRAVSSLVSGSMSQDVSTEARPCAADHWSFHRCQLIAPTGRVCRFQSAGRVVQGSLLNTTNPWENLQKESEGKRSSLPFLFQVRIRKKLN